MIAVLLAACGGLGDDGDSVVFNVDGTEAYMSGVIGSSTPDAVQALLDDHPGVSTIVMLDVPGSGDDESNLEAARLVRAAGLAAHVPADGVIASGGVDFYLAGVRRTYVDGAEFGVHSWAADDGVSGADLPDDDPQHDLFIDYYDEIGVDEGFYWFTLDAAPAESIHVMTDAELAEFDIGTETGS